MKYRFDINKHKTSFLINQVLVFSHSTKDQNYYYYVKEIFGFITFNMLFTAFILP